MTPESALQRQIERYGAMTGVDRQRMALDLHEFIARDARRCDAGTYANTRFDFTS
jgi:hypothetical protein